MKQKMYLLIACAIVLMGQMVSGTVPASASVEEENVYQYEPSPGYEQEIQPFDENMTGEYDRYQVDEQGYPLPDENIPYDENYPAGYDQYQQDEQFQDSDQYGEFEQEQLFEEEALPGQDMYLQDEQLMYEEQQEMLEEEPFLPEERPAE